METAEVKVNLEEIRKDMQAGFKNASNPEGDTKGPVMVGDLPQSRLNIGSTFIKLACRGKNHFQFSLVTKNLSQNVKDQLSHFNEVKDQEVEIYKNAIEQYGTENLSPELIEMINKYANSPLAPIVEFEIEKFKVMKAEAKILVTLEKREGEK